MASFEHLEEYWANSYQYGDLYLETIKDKLGKVKTKKFRVVCVYRNGLKLKPIDTFWQWLVNW